MAWTGLCELGDLREGVGKYVEIGGFQLAVFLHNGTVYAIDNKCPHVGASLVYGRIDPKDGCVICPRHQWGFHLDTGQWRRAPDNKIATYPTRILKREGQEDLVQAELPFP